MRMKSGAARLRPHLIFAHNLLKLEAKLARPSAMVWTVPLVFILVYSRSIAAVPLSSFYEYSSPVDTVLPQNLDDGSSEIITLLTAFPYFGTLQTTAYVRS